MVPVGSDLRTASPGPFPNKYDYRQIPVLLLNWCLAVTIIRLVLRDPPGADHDQLLASMFFAVLSTVVGAILWIFEAKFGPIKQLNQSRDPRKIPSDLRYAGARIFVSILIVNVLAFSISYWIVAPIPAVLVPLGRLMDTIPGNAQMSACFQGTVHELAAFSLALATAINVVLFAYAYIAFAWRFARWQRLNTDPALSLPVRWRQISISSICFLATLFSEISVVTGVLNFAPQILRPASCDAYSFPSAFLDEAFYFFLKCLIVPGAFVGAALSAIGMLWILAWRVKNAWRHVT